MSNWQDRFSGIRITDSSIDLLKAKLRKEEPTNGLRSYVESPLDVQSQLGYKDRRYSTAFELLKRIPSQLAIVNGIIQTRCNQVATFALPFRENKGVGYRITHKDKHRETTRGEAEFIRSLEKFMRHCGQAEHNKFSNIERDNFQTFLMKIVRDSLTLDQTCWEIIPDKKGRPYEFMAIDSSTIRLWHEQFSNGGTNNTYAQFSPNNNNNNNNIAFNQGTNGAFVTPVNTAGKPAYKTLDSKAPFMERPAYVQLIDGKIENVYSRSELAFCIRNPRTDLSVMGYGQSELEMLINTITSHLNAENYNSVFFRQGSNPKGILNFKSEAMTPDMLETFRRQWRNEMEGVQNMWRTPITQSEGLEWIDLQTNNREMEYSAWIEYLIKVTCFTEETPVLMADGTYKAIKDVAPGDRVFTHTGKDKAVSNLQISSHSGDLLVISAGGKDVETTLEHPFFVASSERNQVAGVRTVRVSDPEWKKASDIVEGEDYLVFPKKPYIQSNLSEQVIDCHEILTAVGVPHKVTASTVSSVGNASKAIERFWRIDELAATVLGLYVSEGNTTEAAAFFTFAAKETYLVDKVLAFANRIGAESSSYAAKESTANVRITNGMAASVLSALCGRNAINKKVPICIKLSNVVTQQAFLSGLYEGDGSVPVFTNGSVNVTLSSVSSALIDDAERMLLSMDVFPYRYKVRNSGFATDKPIFRIDVSGSFAAKMAGWLAGTKGDTLRERVLGRKIINDKVLESATYFFVPVTEIAKKNFNGNVYNIEVEDEHTYIVDGFAVHNCAVYQIDPAELNFDMHGGVQQTPLFESSQEWKLKASRDKGLRPMLRFIADKINKHIVSKIDDDYIFEFIGLDEPTEKEKHDMRKEQVASYLTLNEVRRAEDLPDLPEGDVPMNPVYVQILTMKQQADAAQQGAGAGAPPGGAAPPGGQPPGQDPNASQNPEDDTNDHIPEYSDSFGNQ